MKPSVKWEAIDTVLLDMDGTILDLSFDNFFWLEFLPEVYAKANNISLEESQQFLTDSYGAIEGKLQWYCLDFWSERLQLDIPRLKYSVRERVAFRHGAVEFLEFLVDQRKEVYLVTNAHRKSLEIKLLNANFHRYFTDLNSSHDFGFPKEEQAYWNLLQQKYQFQPQRTLFIDDSVRILKAAQDFGIGHIFGIAQPDKNLKPQDCAPFESITEFKKIIPDDQ